MFLVEINYLVPIEVVEEHTVSHRSWLDVEVSRGNILLQSLVLLGGIN